MKTKRYPIIINGEERDKGNYVEIKNPYTEETIAEFSLADGKDIDDACFGVISSFKKLRMSSCEKKRILLEISKKIRERADELAQWVVKEAGKPISLSRIEVERCAQTFEMASGEVSNYGGDVIPIDVNEWTKNYFGFFIYVPKGPVLAITPFNFPLNLLAHKIAPAIAIGAPFVVKPAPQTPVCAYNLLKIAFECGLPKEFASLIYCTNEMAEKMVKREEFEVLSFTGSAKVGWHLNEIAGRKKVLLELGGNAPAIVHEDADINWAARRIALGGFMYAGQICISVQRVYVHEKIYEKFKEELISETKNLKVGNPLERDVIVGPVINREAADRIENWVDKAIKNGAKVLTERKRSGNLIYPIILENPSPADEVVSEEIFGPVICLFPYKEIRSAIEKANDTRYGLQAGIFTKDINLALSAFEDLDYGGVIINDYPTFRTDNYPYGGIKASGIGREGIKFAMLDMSEIKMCVIRR